MKPPFTIKQFLEVFKNYNEAVFPMQIIFYLLGIFVIYLILWKNRRADKIIMGILLFFWLWMGIIYHYIFFTEINKAAYLFGTMFIIQAILFLIYGIFQNKFEFKFRFNIYGLTGILMILFALIVYPILGYFLGHAYPVSPSFGLPCPTTIFTFGLLLLNSKKCPVIILFIPLIWSILGFTASFYFGIYEDIGLVIAGFVTVGMLLFRNNLRPQLDLFLVL